MAFYNPYTGILAPFCHTDNLSIKQLVSVRSAPNYSSCCSTLFCLGNDGQVYESVFLPVDGGSVASWKQLTPLSNVNNFLYVSVIQDGEGVIHFFADDSNSVLYHFVQDEASETGYSSPAPIQTNVALQGAAVNNAGQVEIFTIQQGTRQIMQTYINAEDGNWTVQEIDTQQGGSMEEYIAYSSEIKAFDQNGVPLLNTAVQLTATDATWVTVNGGDYFIGPSQPLQTQTDINGTIALCQQTNSLTAPSLELCYTSVMLPGQTIVVDPFANTQQLLENVQGEDLMNATNMSGDYIIPAQYRTANNTSQAAQAINNCMGIAAARTSQLAKYPTMLHASQPGTWLRTSGDVTDVRKIGALPGEQHWQLSFTDDGLVYKDYSKAEIDAILAEKRATFRSANGFLDWLGDIGDALAGIYEDVITVLDYVVTTVGNAIEVTLTFIIDGVTYIFNTVISALEQAFDVVQSIFASIGTTFENLWEWAGFLFNWDDILRTHEAISYSISQFMGFLSGSVDGVQKMVDNGFANFQSNVSGFFTYAKDSIAGQDSIGGYYDSNKQSSPAITQASANNVVLNNLKANAGSLAAFKPTIAGEDLAKIQDIYDQLSALTSGTDVQQPFDSAINYFTNLGQGSSDIFTQLLTDLLNIAEAVVQAIISGVQAIIDALFNALSALLSTLEGILTSSLNIPFVSELYKYITNGSDLSIQDAAALMIAIPLTSLFKIAQGKAPFADDNALAEFKMQITSTQMLQAAGFAGIPKETNAVAASSYTNFFASFAAVSTVAFGVTSSINDSLKVGNSDISMLIVFSEISAQLGNFPWWVPGGGPKCDASNVDGCTKTLWVVLNLGILIDIVFLASEGNLPENSNDTGIYVQLCYSALAHLPLAIAASVNASSLQAANNIIPVIPELCKALRLNAVATATKYASLPITGILDFWFYGASAGIGWELSTDS